MTPRVVLGYAGGFDAASVIPHLMRAYGAEVVAVTMDLGQGGALEELRDRALAAGALRAHVLDVKDAFAANYLLPSLKADAVGADGAPLVAALAHAIVAGKLVEMAAMEQADAVAHGAASPDPAGAGLTEAIAAAAPRLEVIPVSSGVADEGSAQRVSVNLWGRIVRQPCRNADSALPHRALRVRPLSAAPNEPAALQVHFEQGVPTRINRVPMPFVELIGAAGQLAAAHAIGRIERGSSVIEAPAATVLHAAHRALQARVGAGRDRERVSRQYADIIASGKWAGADRVALDKTVNKWQARVTGDVHVRLFRGEPQILDSI